jgi:hypothetical protein
VQIVCQKIARWNKKDIPANFIHQMVGIASIYLYIYLFIYLPIIYFPWTLHCVLWLSQSINHNPVCCLQAQAAAQEGKGDGCANETSRSGGEAGEGEVRLPGREPGLVEDGERCGLTSGLEADREKTTHVRWPDRQ